MRLLGLLEGETEDFETLAVTAATTEASHRGAWAKTYLLSSGSIRQREAEADAALSDSLHDYKIAEALMKAKRERLLSLRTSIDALRTLNANVRAQT